VFKTKVTEQRISQKIQRVKPVCDQRDERQNAEVSL